MIRVDGYTKGAVDFMLLDNPTIEDIYKFIDNNFEDYGEHKLINNYPTRSFLLNHIGWGGAFEKPKGDISKFNAKRIQKIMRFLYLNFKKIKHINKKSHGYKSIVENVSGMNHIYRGEIILAFLLLGYKIKLNPPMYADFNVSAENLKFYANKSMYDSGKYCQVARMVWGDGLN